MKLIQQLKNITLLLFTIVVVISCKKQDDFLDEKSNIDLTIPTTITDFQDLLNNESVFNTGDPALGALTGEDYYVTNTTINSVTGNQTDCYLFASDIYHALGDYSDWSDPYNAIYVANTVLEGLSKIPLNGQNAEAINQLKGQALFYRSWQLYNLVQTYALPYDSATATSNLGIPLRLSSDFNSKVGRSSVKDCYDQIINDLKNCIQLLPETTSYKTRPTSIAANAALARIYLGMGAYAQALQYADAVLAKYSALLDFNTLKSSSVPISNSFVSEDIFHNVLKNYPFIFYSKYSFIDTTLYASYENNDLRKTVYFIKRSTGNLTFKGSYDYNFYSYSGLATDEMYLIRAECYARSGNTTAAMDDLNKLLMNRWKAGTFIPFTATSSDDALNTILKERRKELIWRGLRWTDLRRLNKENRFKITLTRVANGVAYTLSPNDPKYAMPIPPPEIQLNGIQDNIR